MKYSRSCSLTTSLKNQTARGSQALQMAIVLFNVLSITLKRLNQKENRMAKKMPKANPKADMRENPKPSGKVKKEYVSPASSMVIERGVFGEDLKKNRGK